jgi:RHS repeat-associated protein
LTVPQELSKKKGVGVKLVGKGIVRATESNTDRGLRREQTEWKFVGLTSTAGPSVLGSGTAKVGASKSGNTSMDEEKRGITHDPGQKGRVRNHATNRKLRPGLDNQTSPVSGVTTWAYDEHGEMISEIDARGIVTTRTVDALDRVTLVDYPGTDLDVTYTYDDPLVPFSKGRLTRIARNGGNVDYAYDRFGRLLQDGDLTFQYDANGNRTRIGYPSGIEAVYTHDFADREATLQVEDGASPLQTVVSSATYKPSGPLATLALGNGLAETRSFTTRYFPERIQVPALLDWSYATDAVGNPTAITDNLNAANSRTYTYLDYAYFLTSGNGPWGAQSWTYDKIGNRLSETDEGFTSVYTYPANPAAGNNPKLQSTTAPRGLTFTYGYDAAGNQTTVTETSPEGSGRTITYGYDAASRLAGFSSDYGPASTEVAYDGRGFLRESAKTYTNSADAAGAAATYGSEGLLYSRFQTEQSVKGNVLDAGPRAAVAIEKRTDVLYFAGRPVALRVAYAGGTSNLLYLTTDHLGTPVLTTDEAGAKVWAGGFEPFGSAYDLVQNTEMFLRFPGQWWDGSFGGYAFRDETYYNVHRWYGVGTGRYVRPDPLGLRQGPDVYGYAAQNPLAHIDPDGREVLVCNRRAQGILSVFQANHSYFWDTRPGVPPEKRFCGRGPSDYEQGPGSGIEDEGDQCVPIKGSEGREATLMGCCRTERKHLHVTALWIPWAQDCGTMLKDCAEKPESWGGAGLGFPGIPGGRLGRPCHQCPNPPLPTDPWQSWKGQLGD